MENLDPSGGLHRRGEWSLRVSALAVALAFGGGCAGLDLDRRYRDQFSNI